MVVTVPVRGVVNVLAEKLQAPPRTTTMLFIAVVDISALRNPYALRPVGASFS